jgi:hypothetical protein
MIISLREIGFDGRHGNTAIERKSLRKFEVDLELEVDGDSGQRTDRLHDTVDYSALAELIVSLGAGEPHHLPRALRAGATQDESAQLSGPPQVFGGPHRQRQASCALVRAQREAAP